MLCSNGDGMRAETRMSTSTESQTTPAQAIAKPKRAAMWNVILLDDDDHTYEYVIEMLMKICAIDAQQAWRLAVEVDSTGRVIVMTGMLEHAELKRDQIHSFGRDWRLERSAGSMSAILEPAPGA